MIHGYKHGTSKAHDALNSPTSFKTSSSGKVGATPLVLSCFFFPLNMAWQPWMIHDKIFGGLVKHSQDLKHDDSLAAQQKTLPDRLQDSQDVVACHRLHLFIGQCDEVRQIGDE